jgi:hypothetical protein
VINDIAFDDVNGDAAYGAALICANADFVVDLEKRLWPWLGPFKPVFQRVMTPKSEGRPEGYRSFRRPNWGAHETEAPRRGPTTDIVATDKAAPFGSKGITDIAKRVFGVKLTI